MEDQKMSEFTEVDSLEIGDKIPLVREGSPNNNLVISKENLILQGGGVNFERGIITLSADGSSATLNGDALNHSIEIDMTIGGGFFAVGQTITNSDTGATGVVTSRVGTLYRLNTLTVGSWNFNDDVTNGVLVGKVNSCSWVITMPLGLMKLLFVNNSSNVVNDANNYRQIGSIGQGDETIQSCLSTMFQVIASVRYNQAVAPQSVIMYAVDYNENGWDAYIMNTTDEEFELYFDRYTDGLPLNIYYNAITGVTESES